MVLPNRPHDFLRILQLRFLCKIRVDAHLGCQVGVTEVEVLSENVLDGALEDRGVIL